MSGCPETATTTQTSPTSTSTPVAEEAAPKLRLPADTRPVSQTIELTLDPRKEDYSGRVDINVQLNTPRRTIWLHGKDLRVATATVTPEGGAPINATWSQKDDAGIGALTLSSDVPAGAARVTITFSAKFGNGQKGLYTTSQADTKYAFTQFEAIAARSAFPCFDEPSFKIPYTMTLVVPSSMQAIANTKETARATVGENIRVSFAQTEKLPSYLLALAVGPLDIVPAPDVPANAYRKTPLPLRAVTAKGRGKEVAYALAHTGEMVTALEDYAKVPYPYDKLDIIAIPGKGGAMENPGAVTFGEFLLLFDPKTAPIRQRRSYAVVMAHELAHIWAGDLVTMQWWDDLWLNEAFATWLAAKIADAWDPKVNAELQLLRSVQQAMGTDALVSSRAIRQPIASNDDIENAFDGITYSKGGGVIAMFERWLGKDAWAKGFNAYLQKHSHANASADDLLDAQNLVSGKDVKSAFHTFLDQPGVPFVEVSVACKDNSPATVHLTQSRFLPLGSSGDPAKTWKIPVCMKYSTNKTIAESCTLLEGKTADFTLPAAAGCPDWLLPNADGAGYYRFSLAASDLEKLRKNGLASLSIREKVAYANSNRAAYAKGTTSFGEVIEASAPLVDESDPSLAAEPMGFLGQARNWMYTDPLRAKIEAYSQKLYTNAYKRLGWTPKPGESDETALLRATVLGFFVDTIREPKARAEAKKRGLAYLGVGKDNTLHPEAVDANLVDLCVGVVGEDADRATWDALHKQLEKSVEETERRRLLYALSSGKSKELVELARGLVFDPLLRENEIMGPIWAQLSDEDQRDETWEWLKTNYDKIYARLPKHHAGNALLSTGSVFCDEAHAADVEAFFKPKVDKIEGGPRTLAQNLEDVRLCSARRKVQEPKVREFFEKKK